MAKVSVIENEVQTQLCNMNRVAPMAEYSDAVLVRHLSFIDEVEQSAILPHLQDFG